MCGIAGVFDPRGERGDNLVDLASRMACGIAHRDTDASCSWEDRNGRIAFGHRRLSVIDLSDGGAQPMWSESGASSWYSTARSSTIELYARSCSRRV